MVGVTQIPLEEEYRKGRATPEDVSRLRQWVETQPHLPAEFITDLDLILAYTSTDGSTEVSKQLIDTHFSLKTVLHDLFKDRVVDSKIENVLNNILMQPMPTPTPEGYAVFYAKLLDLDHTKFVLIDCLRAMIMQWELWQYETGSWPGFVMVCDLQGITMGHYGRFNYTYLQHFAYYLQEAFLTKLKGIHLLNAPGFIDTVITMCKPFLKKTILEILYVHTAGSSGLEKYYPIEALPKESGGNWKSIFDCKDEVIAKMKAGSEFFEAENKKRVVEAKRPGKAKTISDFFDSVEGKKLDID